MQTQPQGHDIRRLASMVRGAGCRGNYPPPVEGEKCSLTSPFIEQVWLLKSSFGAIALKNRRARTLQTIFLTAEYISGASRLVSFRRKDLFNNHRR